MLSELDDGLLAQLIEVVAKHVGVDRQINGLPFVSTEAQPRHDAGKDGNASRLMA